MTDAPDFNWNPTEDDEHCIVVRHQPAIAVYINPHDEVVIRQQDWYDQDNFVYVTKDNVLKVAQKMLEIAGLEHAPVVKAKAEPLSAADRAKRYRHKKRHEERHEERDEVALERDANDSPADLRLVAAE